MSSFVQRVVGMILFDIGPTCVRSSINQYGLRSRRQLLYVTQLSYVCSEFSPYGFCHTAVLLYELRDSVTKVKRV